MIRTRLRPKPFDPRDRTQALGERKLWLAAIAQAANDTHMRVPTYGEGRWKLVNAKQDAIEWISDESGRVYGFVWCCESVGVDPSWIREAIFSGGMQVDSRGYRGRLFVVKGGFHGTLGKEARPTRVLVRGRVRGLDRQVG